MKPSAKKLIRLLLIILFTPIVFIFVAVAYFVLSWRVSLFYFPYGNPGSHSSEGIYLSERYCVEKAVKLAMENLKNSEKFNVAFFCALHCRFDGDYSTCNGGIFGECTKEDCKIRNIDGHDLSEPRFPIDPLDQSNWTFKHENL
jgi:hypothetical protein